MRESRGFDEQAFIRLLGWILRAGVMISAAVVLAGGAIYLSTPDVSVDYRVFRGQPTDIHTIAEMLMSPTAGHGRGLIELGLLLLITTPIARVVFSVIGFTLEHDWLYVSLTLVVIGILGYGLLVA